jgi:hypothetical protein
MLTSDMIDEAISLFNAGACGVIGLALLWAVLSKHVLDGVVVKGGLIAMVLGFTTIALRYFDMWHSDAERMDRALLLINMGVAVVIIGYVFRRRQVGHPLRRFTDYSDLDSSPFPPLDERRGARK